VFVENVYLFSVVIDETPENVATTVFDGLPAASATTVTEATGEPDGAPNQNCDVCKRRSGEAGVNPNAIWILEVPLEPTR